MVGPTMVQRLLVLLCCVMPITAFAQREPKRVVIDPGHGGQNMGAIGPYGVYEKYIALSIAMRLGALLEREEGIVVFYTRKDDVFVGLAERAELANALNADAFVSIHLNADPSGRARGFEVYYFGPEASDTHAKEVALRENEHFVPKEDPTLSAVLEAIQRNGTLLESQALAEAVLAAFERAFPEIPSRDVRQASFTVLERARVPAIVVEVGFITHPQEGLDLLLSSYQDRIAWALYEALLAFLRQAKAF